jgi:hypothetical protein
MMDEEKKELDRRKIRYLIDELEEYEAALYPDARKKRNQVKSALQFLESYREGREYIEIWKNEINNISLELLNYSKCKLQINIKTRNPLRIDVCYKDIGSDYEPIPKDNANLLMLGEVAKELSQLLCDMKKGEYIELEIHVSPPSSIIPKISLNFGNLPVINTPEYE